MSTATTRLRRAGAGGLAAAVIAGTLIAGSGIAQAAATTTVANKTGPTTVYVGGTAQAGDSIVVTLPTGGWSIGQTVVFDLPGTCGVATNTIGLSGTPTGVAAKDSTATAATDILPTFNITTSTGTDASCVTAGVKHEFTLTLTNNTTANQTASPTITISNVAYNVGSTVTAGVPLTLAVTGTAIAATTLNNANISNTKLATTGVVPGTTGSSALALGNITASDVGGSVITSKLFFHASGSYYFGSATPKVTGGGLTWTVAGMGSQTLTATGTGTLTSAANTFVLSGATLGTTANTNPVGVAAVTASFGAAYPGTTIGTVNVASVVTQSRVGGSDRYSTAAALFNKNFAANPNHAAVLASGANFPDALSATFLAAQEKTGTLLTTPLALPSVTLNSLITNQISTVYIVGGPGAVSNGVSNQIAATHVANVPTNAFINVVRIWGADRYATNKAVNEYNFASQPTAIIATGENFADALSVGPAVYDQQFPLVLTTTAALSASASQQLTDMGTKNVVIVGGTGAVSSAVETALKGMGITIVARLAGTDRTQTAAAIATWETNATTATPVAGLGFDQTTAHVSNGANFPDALAAGPVAGAAANVILLSLSPTSLGAGAPAYLGGLNTPTTTTVDTLNALGLTGAVSPAVMNAAAVALAG